MEIPEATRELLLRRWPVARLATLGPEGPQLVPIVFAWHEERLWMPVDAKPKREGELARVRNVQRCAAVSLLLDHYDPDWTLLWWLRIDGEARVVAPADVPGSAVVLDRLVAKYPQYHTVPLLTGSPSLVVVRPGRVVSWCASAAAARRARV